MSTAAHGRAGSPSTAAACRPVAILPARLGSTRLARKMLLARTGTPLVVHTLRRVRQCARFERVLVATDHEDILQAVRAAGFEALLTSRDHVSGTDRVREAAAGLDPLLDPVVNVQADEPEVDPRALAELIDVMAAPEVEVATLATPMRTAAERASPGVVKVVWDERGDALYFSRAPIPDDSHARGRGDDSHARGRAGSRAGQRAGRHVGVYAYRRAALERFCGLPESPLERCENLEQLRWLEAGGRMRVLSVQQAARGIDTEEDYADFVARHGRTQPHAQR